MRNLLKLLGSVLVCFGLVACGSNITRNPVPDSLANDVRPFGKDGMREWGDKVSQEEIQAIMRRGAPRLKARLEADKKAGRETVLEYLALSGGGQWGAFGAGILEAWSKAGTRPEFIGVSGISTGAIIAPFAFLGTKYDSVLHEIYSKYSTDDLVESTVFSGVLTGTALSDTSRLADVIASYITPELLQDIAAEYRKGRYLLIGTTNLDAGRPVLWDIGAIAASGEPGALDLVRSLIRASSAIPVAFPPIFIDVEAPDGRTFDEMHVDGGAASQVTFVSPQISLAALTREAIGHNLRRRLWVIVNNDLEPPHQYVKPRLPDIAGAAVSSLIRGSGSGDLYRLYAIALRDEIDYNASWIPDETGCPDPQEDFDPAFMKCLFHFGEKYFESGQLWRKGPPNFALPSASTKMTIPSGLYRRKLASK